MTTSGLTPKLALEYLEELSTDIRAGVVLDHEGKTVAGDRSLGEATRDLLAASDAQAVEVHTDDGIIYGARSKNYGLGIVCGRFVLSALMLYDLRMVLSDLEKHKHS